MPANVRELNETEKLTGEDLVIPQMDDREYITLRRVADSVRDMRAELAAYGSFLRDDDDNAPDADITDEVQSIAPAARVDTPRYLRERFEYMCMGWKLYDTDGNEITYTRSNRDKIWSLWAPQLTNAINARAGGVAKLVSGKDAAGNQLEFRNGHKVHRAKSVAGPVDAGGVLPGAAGEDHQGNVLELR